MAGRRQTSDHYARKAKRENYPARSVYKLEEIDRRVKLLRKGDRVIDLGAAPGSWTLYAAEQVGPGGLVVAVDLSPLSVGVPAHVVVIQGDALGLDAAEFERHRGAKGFDAVLSDMAPHTSGHRFVDQSKSFALFGRALDIAEAWLRPGGRFVGKIFQGEAFGEARDRVRRLFETARIIRPASVRTESYEIYIVGLNRKRP